MGFFLTVVFVFFCRDFLSLNLLSFPFEVFPGGIYKVRVSRVMVMVMAVTGGSLGY